MVWILVPLGLLTGATINLLADSLPTRRSLKRPFCAQCGQTRPPLAWSGLLAYLTGKHCCPNCGRRLSIRHPLVEIGAAAAFALIGLRGGAPITLIANLIYAAVLLLVLVTDLEHRLIQHVIMLPAIALALLAAFVDPQFDRPVRSLLGGGIGLLLALGMYWFGILFTKLLGKARGKAITEVAFGFGDVTLITFIGLIVGAPEVIFALIIGILIGGAGSILYLIISGLILHKYSAFTAIPYGPFLILGGALMRYLGQALMAWYFTR
ncbi:MAG: prepilin peptidase [Anaerolineae bacterium]|nr:prepilin peptidase [Anaerolineae bacterium]